MQPKLKSPFAVFLLATAASLPLGCADPSDPPRDDAGPAQTDPGEP